ncbi:hypothetical protein [Streptomyces hirsutus]
MAVPRSHGGPRRFTAGTRFAARREHESAHPAVITRAAARIVAAARVVMGFVFLWPLLDKTFGLGYATPSSKAWINGGSPTMGYLGSMVAGPLESVFHAWAGAVWADWLFMLALLGIGLAFLGGVALRPAALCGTVLLALMWIADWPPAQHLSNGAPSMSTNPIVDYHFVYAVLLIMLAALRAGDTWGLGRRWAALPVARDHAWLR